MPKRAGAQSCSSLIYKGLEIVLVFWRIVESEEALFKVL
jgi:hypothetical protein